MGIRKVIATSIFSFFLLISATCFSESYTNDERINIKIYEEVSPSIVAIDADINEGVSSGTGCIIDSKGLILTSKHVIEGFKDLKITLPDGTSYPGKIISSNADNSDFVIIKINPHYALQTIKFGDSSNVKVGQRVLALGNPFGFNRTLTTGIISRVDKKRNKIQTDAAINPGSSGGPLLNLNGEVIGINQSIYNPDNNKSNIGIGFAIPVNTAKNFIRKAKVDNSVVFVE